MKRTTRASAILVALILLVPLLAVLARDRFYDGFDMRPIGSYAQNTGPMADDDSDGLPNKYDPCPSDATNTCNIQPVVVDNDADGLPDGSDPCPNDPSNTCNVQPQVTDSDADGLPDASDPPL